MKVTIRMIGALGVILFGTAFIFTFHVPGGVEEIAKDFIKEKIEEKTREKIDSLSFAGTDSALSKLVQRLSKSKEQEITKLKNKLQDKVHEKTATVIAEMRDFDCKCREKYAQSVKRHTQFRIASLQSANDRLLSFMKSTYMNIVQNITLDLRFFSGSNLAIFILVLLLSFLKPKAIAHLFLPGILLVISTALSSYFYLFEQNWVFTIIYNDFLGFWYLVWIGLIFAILSDIVFNSARVTTQIINTIFEAIGSAFSLAPC